MERLTMWTTWIWKIAPVFFIIIPLLIGYSDSEAKYFCIFFIGLAIYMFFFSEAKVFLKLHNIYIKNQNLIIQKSVSLGPRNEIPFDNALRVEYLPFVQQIIGKFWYLEPKTLERTFVYFWPTKAEAKWESSTLYRICTEASFARENNQA